MSYLKEFLNQISLRDFPKFMQLWEEYCTNDVVDLEELLQILRSVKNSDFSKSFGRVVETVLPMWQTLESKDDKYLLLKEIIDIETTNSPNLAEVAFQALKERYGQQAQFNERIRLVGLRNRENFQGSLANYDLLSHMEAGNFVFHNGGWGTGEIVEVSPVREQLTIEFENVSGRKILTFINAFKTLIPLQKQDFRVRRFAEPDTLEQQARDNSTEIIKMLLADLGPKTASEIKDEMCELVIPEADWTKWWQNARAKLKKDPIIEAPESVREPFRLRKSEITHAERMHKAIHTKSDLNEIVLNSYNFIRDLPGSSNNQEVRNSVKEKLLGLFEENLSKDQILQITLLLETMFNHRVEGKTVEEQILALEKVEEAINAIEILALKKRALTAIREYRKDWNQLFLNLLYSVQQSALRDYILKELNQKETRKFLEEALKKLLAHPERSPEAFVWYFQKIVNHDEEGLPFSDKEGQCQLFEAFLILYSYAENKPEYRDLIKKMYNLLSGKRYAIVRAIIEGTSLEFIKEFLLLVAKCHTLSDHDIKILRSLAEVVHPSLSPNKQRKSGSQHDVNIIWTTEEGYLKTQERIRQIGTTEIVENAREIEAARALGDLRENSEYKFALEKRSRLQGELKSLSEQLGRARIITKDDVSLDEVGVGSIIEVKDGSGNKVKYSILGPWDANPDENILSSQSKLAQAMMGCKKGDTFQFRDEEYTITNIKSFLD